MLSFNVLAGSVDTTFTITSALVSFAAINPAEGRASASLTVTDLNGNGVTLTPGADQGGAYTSRYNGLAPGGTLFHDFFSTPLTTPIPGDSTTVAGDFPGGGAFVPIAGSVVSISSRFSFTLSANDLASGTSVFRVVPAPASLSLLGLGGLLGARRRRNA
jgi:hypothetical protein